MMALKKIDEIVGEIALKELHSVAGVTTEPAVDSDGRDALRITIILKPGAVAKLGGDALLDTLVQIQHSLLKAGDERFPFVGYATQAELDDSVDPQS